MKTRDSQVRERKTSMYFQDRLQEWFVSPHAVYEVTKVLLSVLCMGVLIPATFLSHRLAEPCRSFRPEKGAGSPISVGWVTETSHKYMCCRKGLFHLPEPLG